MRQKILLIAGIGHSGSTMLDLVLGGHPQVRGGGEVSKVLRTPLAEYPRRYEQGSCSCGARPVDCSFWSDSLSWLKDHQADTVEQKYDAFIRHFQQQYGDNKILLDSSKTVRPFMAYLHEHYDVRVIFLVRDIRSWVNSRRSQEGKGVLSLMMRWKRGNQRTERFLKRHNMATLTLGYEELALYPEIMLQKVCDFAGIDYTPAMLDVQNSQSHIIRGNNLRADPEKKAKIRYDARWMVSPRLMAWGPLFWFFMAANRRWVYSHFITGRSKAFGVRQDDVMLFGCKRKETVSKALQGRA
ncbi:MAG: sulfotransferase [Halomonadaceae bacterium]|nr:MAG: sulfotransferase [Halomonadaceae bacterium]